MKKVLLIIILILSFTILSFAKDNVEKVYYDNGKLERETPYVNGLKNGMTKYYYNDGALQVEILYKDDKKEGISKGYYPSGKLAIKTLFKDDKKEDIETIYNLDNSILLTIVYENNIAISGKCGNGRQLNSAEISNWNKNLKNIQCE